MVSEAVAVLHTEFPRLGLIIGGDGPLLDELRARAASLGIEDSVRFLGFVEDVRPLYEACDAFVLASQTEGMPIAVLEAMALEIPIVASRVGGIPQMLSDGTEAMLVEPNDYRSLYEALRRLIVDARLRTNMVQAARRGSSETIPLSEWPKRIFGYMMMLRHAPRMQADHGFSA